MDLNATYKEELEGVISYAELYKSTGNGIFKDIAREEMTHARLIKNEILKCGQLEDMTELEEKAKAALESI